VVRSSALQPARGCAATHDAPAEPAKGVNAEPDMTHAAQAAETARSLCVCCTKLYDERTTRRQATAQWGQQIAPRVLSTA
jgi:hypothetical protein